MCIWLGRYRIWPITPTSPIQSSDCSADLQLSRIMRTSGSEIWKGSFLTGDLCDWWIEFSYPSEIGRLDLLEVPARTKDLS